MQWRTVPGFSDYEVSEIGEIRRGGKTIKPQPHNGYLRVKLVNDDGRKENIFVHRLVVLAFVGPPPTSDHEVAHNDGSRTNNAVTNLRWATRSENALDKHIHGTFVLTPSWDNRGELNGHAILDEEAVREIRSSAEPTKVLSVRFGVTACTIRDIRSGRRWKHLLPKAA